MEVNPLARARVLYCLEDQESDEDVHHKDTYDHHHHDVALTTKKEQEIVSEQESVRENASIEMDKIKMEGEIKVQEP